MATTNTTRNALERVAKEAAERVLGEDVYVTSMSVLTDAAAVPDDGVVSMEFRIPESVTEDERFGEVNIKVRVRD